MPNKYSHAQVVSHYESRGLISFPHRSTPRPANTEPSHSERKARPSASAVKGPSSPPRTPLPPLPLPSPCPPTAHDGESVTSSSHRPTPSVITEIYAPEQPSVDTRDRVPIQSRLDPQNAQISPVTTTGSSLTSETSYLAEATPRTSVSSVGESTGKRRDETGNGKRSQPRPSRSSNSHDTSRRATSHGGVVEKPKRAVHPENGVGHTDDKPRHQAKASPPPLRIVPSPPKPLKSLVDEAKPHSFFYFDSCSARPWEEDRLDTPAILCIPSSRHPPRSSGSSSPDDAAPPPISRHRHQIAPTTTKSDRLTVWTKPAKTDGKARTMPHTIRDLTGEVTPWEECDDVTLEVPCRTRLRETKRVPEAMPWESYAKSGSSAAAAAAAAAKVNEGAAVAKKSPRGRRISRIRRRYGHGGDQGVEKEKPMARDDGGGGGGGGGVGMKARYSRAYSDSDEEFLAQFESDGYFLR